MNLNGFALNVPLLRHDILGLMDSEMGISVRVNYTGGRLHFGVAVACCLSDGDANAEFGGLINKRLGGVGAPLNGRSSTEHSFYWLGGAGEGEAMPRWRYTPDYLSPSPIRNRQRESFFVGQVFNKNHNLNRWTTIGVVGGRMNDFTIQTGNDLFGMIYLGGGTDQGWTGNLNIGIGDFDFGYENYTGAGLYDEKGIPLPDPNPQYPSLWLPPFREGYIRQPSGEMSWNRASTYLRYSCKEFRGGLEVLGDGWLQHLIHDYVSKEAIRFQYPEQFNVGPFFEVPW